MSYLSKTQIDQFNRDGFLLLKNVLEPEMLANLSERNCLEELKYKDVLHTQRTELRKHLKSRGCLFYLKL